MKLISSINLLDQKSNNKEEKALTYQSVNKFFNGAKKVLNVFEKKTLPIRKPTQGLGRKKLAAEQKFQKFQ